MSEEKICGLCKWHTKFCASEKEWICNNERSDYYALDTEYEDECEEWEKRE